jgi:transposase InsO family protein
MWIVLLPTKDGVPAAIKNVKVAAERKSGKKLCALCTDRRGEVTANHFKEYFAELGIQRDFNTPYSPPQNGIVEQCNQTVMGAARSMLKAKDLPGTFWGEAIIMAVCIINRSSSKGADGRTSYELWTGIMPSVHHLRTFGCVAHVKDTRSHLCKLNDRSKPSIFVGYEPGSMAYHVYDPASKCIHITRDMVFDEEAKWSWGCDKIDSEFIIEYAEDDEHEVVITRQAGQEVNPVPGVGAAAPCSVTMGGEQYPVLGAGAAVPHSVSPGEELAFPGPTVVHSSPPAGNELDLDADHDGEARLRFHTL